MSIGPDPRDPSARIELDSYHRPSVFRGGKWVLAVLVAVLAGGWLAVEAFQGDRTIYHAGNVSEAHRFIGHRCEVCHTETWGPLKRLAKFDSAAASVADQACLTCHDGTIHHANQIAADVPHCAACHREHEGSDVQLARVNDAFCIECHADLKTSDGKGNFVADIDSFAAHPEFAIFRSEERVGREHQVREVATADAEGTWQDRGAIKLNHAVHLNPQGILRMDGTREVLDCTSCHEPAADGGFMQPINYEQHCAECHAGALNFDQDNFPKSPAPHREIDLVRAVLRDRYATLEQPEQKLDATLGFPGRPPLSDEQRQRVEERVRAAEAALLNRPGGCRYCHTVQEEASGEYRIVPPAIPTRWLAHGEFRHDRHRLLACGECHSGTEQSKHTADILLPKIDVCRRCHTDDSCFAARSDCVECHDYHNHLGEAFNGAWSLDMKVLSPERLRDKPGPGRFQVK